MKAAESRHPVAAFGKRNVLDYLMVFRQRPWRFERLDSEGVTLCYACGKMVTLPGIVKTMRDLIKALFVMHVERMVT